MIQEKEYKFRRNTLAKKLSKNSIAVLYSAEEKTRSNDTQYPYRQDSNFYYLTGFKESNSALVIIKKKNKYKSILFVQKKDKELELWTGKRLGKKDAKKRFDIDKVYISKKINKKIKKFLIDKKSLYYDFKSITKSVEKLIKLSSNISNKKDISPEVEVMRLIKSSSEINLIQKAINITKEAHHYAMSKEKFGKREYELQADIEYVFKKNGAYSDAYTSIVACANSANTLHYISNNQLMQNNELILIDAGCEYDYYASDITRTIPVNGKFTLAQTQIYQLVLDTQLKIIDMIKPDVMRTLLQEKTEFLLTEGLVKLGILKGDVKKLIKNKKHKTYYPHGIGHWMGLDVHDNAPYTYKDKKEIPLKQGMVLTIEPGLYLNKNDKNIPKKYRGIGIRIEDDILITKDGYKNLSKDIVKNISDIESLMGTVQ
jgi:Xaa-Pro aminopeptidase